MDERATSDIKPKKRFSSFFGRFSGPKDLNSKRGKDAGTEDKASTMILKLKSPGAAGDKAEESNGQLLSDILTNEQLFERLYGKSLVLQAEMSVEKHKDDGSPKTMTISGLVPVTLSRGERNGKPTRELRVRGHLRRKRSKEIRLPYDDLALKSAGFGAGGRRREITLERRPGHPEESKLLQRNSKILERYRTLSTVSTKSKRDSVWPLTDVEAVDSDEDPEPSRIENWSPLFDFSSPMSGPTGRDRVRALSDWTTPTPRFDLDLMKDEGGEDRSKDKVQDTDKEKRLRYDQHSQKPKDDFKIIDRTLEMGRTDSSDKDEYDKCSAKPCCKGKRIETRDFGSQTFDPDKGKEVTRVHSSTQTDALMRRESSPDVSYRTPKMTNLLSPEEIHQKFTTGFKDSKQMISSVHEKATNKFAEVHGKIQNAIANRAGGKQASEYQESNQSPIHSDRYDQGYPEKDKIRHQDEFRSGAVNDIVQNTKLNNHSRHIREIGHINHPTGHDQSQSYGPGHPNGEVRENSNIKKYDSLHDNRSKSSPVSISRDRFHPGETTKDTAPNNFLGISHPRHQGREESKNHAGRYHQAHENENHEKQKDIQNLHYNTERGYYYQSSDDDPPKGKNKTSDKGYENFKKQLNMTKHGTAYPHAIEDAREFVHRRSQKQDGEQQSIYQGGNQPSTAKQIGGYYYESSDDDPLKGKNKTSDKGYENFKKQLNMTKHGTAYPHAIEGAQEFIHRRSQKQDGEQQSIYQGENQPSTAKQMNGSNGSTNVDGEEKVIRKDTGGSINEDGKKSKSGTPTSTRMHEDSKKSQEKLGRKTNNILEKVEAKHLNPIATITVSRSHTRLYNYSDGYTYTEKAGRQMVVIEAPKGMYFAS